MSDAQVVAIMAMMLYSHNHHTMRYSDLNTCVTEAIYMLEKAKNLTEEKE